MIDLLQVHKLKKGKKKKKRETKKKKIVFNTLFNVVTADIFSWYICCLEKCYAFILWLKLRGKKKKKSITMLVMFALLM